MLSRFSVLPNLPGKATRSSVVSTAKRMHIATKAMCMA